MSPKRISRVSSRVGSAILTTRKRRDSASSSWMISLYSVTVVAPMIWTSPRARLDLKMLAASEGTPMAEPAPIRVCASSMKRMMFLRSLTSAMTFSIRSSNIPRKTVPATTVFICRFTIWLSRRRSGTRCGSYSSRMASPSATAVLPTPGSPMIITELLRSLWHRYSMIWSISRSRPMIGGIFPSRARRFRFTPNTLRFAGSSYRLRNSSTFSSRLRNCEANRERARAGSTP